MWVYNNLTRSFNQPNHLSNLSLSAVTQFQGHSLESPTFWTQNQWAST